MSKWTCPRCRKNSTMVVSHGKWSVELFCFHCEEFVKDFKKNKLRLERSSPGLFRDEEW